MKKALLLLILCNFIFSDAPEDFDLACDDISLFKWTSENKIVLKYQRRENQTAIFIRGLWDERYISKGYSYWKKDDDFYYFGKYSRDTNSSVLPELGRWSTRDFYTLKVNRETLEVHYKMNAKDFAPMETIQCKAIAKVYGWSLYNEFKEQNEKNIEAEKERIKKKNKI